MKKLILSLSLFLFSSLALLAQDYLGIYATKNVSGIITNGPAYTESIMYLTPNNNTGNDPATGVIGVSAEYSNQTYTNIPDNPAGHDAMMFGGKSNNTAKQLETNKLLVSMNDVGTPSNSYYTPAEDVSGMSVSDHYAFEQYVSVEGLENNNVATLGKTYMGDVTYTFTSPVDNPLLHVTGLGGFFGSEVSGAQLLFSAEYVLKSGATSLTKLSGTSNLGDTPLSTYTETDFSQPGNGPGTDGDEAGSGTFRVVGTNITSVTFEVWIEGKVANQEWSTLTGETPAKYTGERFNSTWTIPLYDFCGEVYVDNDRNGTVGPDASPDGQTTGGLYTQQGVNAVLVNDEGKVVAVSPVDANGKFCFNAPSNSYSVVLRTDSPAIGSTAPTTSALPFPYLTPTEEAIGGTTVDGTPDGITAFSPVDYSSAPTTSTLRLGISTLQFNPSPVTYTSFNAENKGAYNVLSWETSSEENNKGYFVERSIDGKVFVELGFVEGNGSTKEAVSYRFVDEKPSSDNYYRLRQVDHDGKSTISEIRYVRIDGLNRRISVYPNPFVDGLTIETGNYDDAILVEVMDATGRLVIQHKTTERYIDLSNAKTGAYIVSVKSSKGELLLQKKVVKIH